MNRNALALLLTMTISTLFRDAGAGSAPIATSVADPTGTFAGLIELADSRHISAECAGTGAPTALLPNTPHLAVSDSSHDIQLQRPKLVTAAILRVVDDVRLE